jgi:hypothetical protein
MEKAVLNSKTLFTIEMDLNLMKKLVSATREAQHFTVPKPGYLGKELRNTWKVLKYGASGGWR